ncbi:hypothetical protein ATE84_1312 [Aquimarina sp. MAR_2010_214]|uniref:hypothetical protein n=1 Tax=Aquimarina sp. MAR_2010_214 TaxID=1250026 RepID=UPI000C7142F1|nr:hypothetical protein [Aquimarina sp. MAR_2010_214]PKV49291.1 hypothetical protein ATE84_1312 [Aquimarina sp. MAR_2010_214]
MNIINIYRLSLENKKKEAQILSHFNGETDFLNTLEEFCNHTFREIHYYTDNKGRQRSFSLASPAVKDLNQRSIVGIFEPGYTGDKFKVKDGMTNSLKYSASRRDLQSRELFTMIYIPKNTEYAYLCIEKKENFSIKTVIENTLNKFLKESGYLDYKLKIENSPNYNYLRRMIIEGELKEMNLIREKPLTFDEKPYSSALDKARVNRNEQVYKFNKESNTTILKNELFKVFREKYSEFQKINFLGSLEEFDEISFILSLDKITKTFYVKDKSKIRSNMDITNLVDIVEGEVVLDSLIKACFMCIGNIENSSFDDIEDVA